MAKAFKDDEFSPDWEIAAHRRVTATFREMLLEDEIRQFFGKIFWLVVVLVIGWLT